jgi:hypothetical protein
MAFGTIPGGTGVSVRQEGMRRYLERFRAEYMQAAERYLPSESREGLLLYRLLRDGGVKGYVSTQFGAGFDVRADASGVEVVHGSKRVELQLLGLPRKYEKTPPLVSVKGIGVALGGGGRFSGALPFLLEADPSDVAVAGLHWELDSHGGVLGYAFVASDRSEEYWSEANAVRRSAAEVMKALVHLDRAKTLHVTLDEYAKTWKERIVLVLGAYDDEGRKRLAPIQQKLTALGWDPVLVEDVRDIPQLDLQQKVELMAHLARFVVVEDTEPAGQQAEMVALKSTGCVMVVLRRAGSSPGFMTRGVSIKSKVIKELEYTAGALEGLVEEGAAWADAKVEALADAHGGVYPWRG